MKRKPTAAETNARKGRRRRMFGAEAICFLCGYSNPTALILVKKTLLEEHHVVGLANDDSVRVPVCRRCHALLTEDCRDIGADMGSQRSLLEKLAEMNRIRSVFDRAAADMEAVMATKLDKLTQLLDEHCPNWRSICGTDRE